MALESEAVLDGEEVVDNEVVNTDEVKSENNDDESTIEITIEGESLTPDEVEDETEAPEWVKNLRVRQKELAKENKALKEQLEKVKPKEPELKLSDKPTLAECDYDADIFEERLEKWYEEKRVYESKQNEIAQAEANRKKAWDEKLNAYQQSKAALKIKDFDLYEDNVKTKLSDVQQSILVDVMSNSAAAVVALGKNEALLDEMSKMNPAQFSYALGKLETKLKITERKSPPVTPSLKGDASGSGVDSTLERLRAEAAKTGDMTKVVAYKRSLKNKT